MDKLWHTKQYISMNIQTWSMNNHFKLDSSHTHFSVTQGFRLSFLSVFTGDCWWSCNWFVPSFLPNKHKQRTPASVWFVTVYHNHSTSCDTEPYTLHSLSSYLPLLPAASLLYINYGSNNMRTKWNNKILQVYTVKHNFRYYSILLWATGFLLS